MNTTSVRIKFRESTIDGKEGTLYYQVIHNRMVRQIGTDYHLRSEEWQEDEGNIVLGKSNTNERKDYLRELAERIRSDRLRFARIVSELDNNGIGYTADDVVAKYNELTSRQSVQVYIECIIRQQKAQGRHRTAETYAATMRSFMAFREGKDISWDCVTPALVKSYEVWLKTKGVSLNTVSFPPHHHAGNRHPQAIRHGIA